MFVVPAQQMKDSDYSTTEQIFKLEPVEIDLNGEQEVSTNLVKPMFDHQVVVCRNTNVVFSPYSADVNGMPMNKVRCAFLGQFVDG